MAYKSPGVYVEEISKLPPSVAQVETAIPAFIGYTELTNFQGQNLVNFPVRIKGMAEFTEIFGGAFPEPFSVSFTGDDLTTAPAAPAFPYKMYNGLQLYFANGGGPCFIVTVGAYKDAGAKVVNTELSAGLAAIRKEDEPTLLLFPDATTLSDQNQFYSLYAEALTQCAQLGDRFTIIDVHNGYLDYTTINNDIINGNGTAPNPTGIRTGIGINNLKYGAAYYPWLETIYEFSYDASAFVVNGVETGQGAATSVMKLKHEVPAEGDPTLENESLFHINPEKYNQVVKELRKLKMHLPAGAAMAGIYARVDSARGVWKAPANESLIDIKGPVVKLDNDDQASLNVHSSGKSVNAIRNFSGKGTIVWGARTLAGNDNEWKYINVRRFYNMVEESTKKASEQFVFEPNDGSTWAKVRGMIENFLILQWRAGALQGAVPEDAFFVKVGLGETMTALDILEGRMIVEIGMAVVRPAEFIILKFSHKMVES